MKLGADVASKLRGLRISFKWTHAQAAKFFNTNETTIAGIESRSPCRNNRALWPVIRAIYDKDRKELKARIKNEEIKNFAELL